MNSKKEKGDYDSSMGARLHQLANRASNEGSISMLEKELRDLGWMIDYAWVIINSDHEESGIHDEWLELYEDCPWEE